MTYLGKSLCWAAGTGFIAALPIIAAIVPPTHSAGMPEILNALFVVVCPPWKLFWGLMGQPQDMTAAIRIALEVLIINSALYVPIGPMYVKLKARSQAIRWTACAIAYFLIIGLAHMFFIYRT
jgi:hypothetical protein